jgi:hypothetical protein
VSLGLYEVIASIASADVDPGSHDVFVFEQFEHPVPKIAELFASSDALAEFRGGTTSFAMHPTRTFEP